MEKVDANQTALERIKGLCAIRNIVRDLIATELDENSTEDSIKSIQNQLNESYDSFVKSMVLLIAMQIPELSAKMLNCHCLQVLSRAKKINIIRLIYLLREL